jgi:hypothetical protein
MRIAAADHYAIVTYATVAVPIVFDEQVHGSRPAEQEASEGQNSGFK